MTITKGRQTVYIRDHDSLDPFEWAGACSALGAIRAPVGDIDFRSGTYDPAALFQVAPKIEVESGPGPIEDTLTLTKEVRNALVEQWLRCRWDVDVRYQDCPRRDDRTNWVGITRLCRAKFLEYSSDGDEVVVDPDSEGVMLIASALKAPWPLVHIWRLTAALIDVSATEDFTAIAVCEDEQCADAVGRAYGCVLKVGTTSFTSPSPFVYTSRDSGETWTPETLSEWSGDVNDIDCLGDLTVVVSDDEAEVMWSEGSGWTQVVLPGRPWAVHIYDPGLIVIVGENGYIARSLNAARAFTTVGAGTTPEDLYDVVAVDSQVWWAIGDNNAIVRSEDGAATWDAIDGPVVQAAVDVTAILALDENRILLGYADGELWYTEDGSEDDPTWVEDDSLTGFVEIMRFAECGCGRVMVTGYDVAGNGLVYESVDSGAPGTWSQIDVPAAMGHVADIVCCDANTWIGISSGVYLSGDLGQILKIA